MKLKKSVRIKTESGHVSLDDLMFAADLATAGWVQTSRNNRVVSRVKPGVSMVEAFSQMPLTVGRALSAMAREPGDGKQRAVFALLRYSAKGECKAVEHKRLTQRQFEAFRLVGGKVA